MPINVKLLRRIQKKIIAAPEAFDMGTFASHSDDAPCGTAACIAGWATLLQYRRSPVIVMDELKKLSRDGNYDYEKRARKELGLTPTQAKRLFFIDDWPDSFVRHRGEIVRRLCGISYNSRRKRKLLHAKMAQVGVDRIEHFIKTKGKE